MRARLDRLPHRDSKALRWQPDPTGECSASVRTQKRGVPAADGAPLTELSDTCSGNFTGTEGIADTLTLRPAARRARILSLLSDEILDAVTTQPLTFEAHSFGVWLPDFECAADYFALEPHAHRLMLAFDRTAFFRELMQRAARAAAARSQRCARKCGAEARR